MKLIASDIDGVLTDGCVYLDAEGRETKKICYRDLDAAGVLRSAGFKLALITGESGEMAQTLAGRFGSDYVIYGAKDKREALLKLSVDSGVELRDIVYIGDGDRDAPAILAAGFGMTPYDATEKAKGAADCVLKTPGGGGVLHEAAERLKNMEPIWEVK